jgi:hypothetical protein
LPLHHPLVVLVSRAVVLVEVMQEQLLVVIVRHSMNHRLIHQMVMVLVLALVLVILAQHPMNHQLIGHQLVEYLEELSQLLLLLILTTMVFYLYQNFEMLDFRLK